MEFDTKETVVKLNGVHVEAFPSPHLDAMRSLTNPKFILQEEWLEAEGATDIESITYFPASNTRIIKCSQTPEERAEQRMFEYYNK